QHLYGCLEGLSGSHVCGDHSHHIVSTDLSDQADITGQQAYRCEPVWHVIGYMTWIIPLSPGVAIRIIIVQQASPRIKSIWLVNVPVFGGFALLLCFYCLSTGISGVFRSEANSYLIQCSFF